WHEHEKHDQESVVQGEYPKDSSHPEPSEVVRRALRVTKNASDEKPGENEEHVHAAPPHVGKLRDQATEWRSPDEPRSVVAGEVVESDEQDGDSTHAVQSRKATAKFRPDGLRVRAVGTVESGHCAKGAAPVDFPRQAEQLPSGWSGFVQKRLAQ